MNRIETLTLKLLDGTSTPAEAAELANAITQDPDAKAEFLALRNVEAALRELGGRDDVAPQVMAHIRRSGSPGTAARAPSVAGTSMLQRAAAAAVIMVGLGVLSLLVGERWERLQTPPSAAPNAARLEHVEGQVQTRCGPGNSAPAVVGSLRNVDRLLVGPKSVAVVTLPDGTRVTCHPDSALALFEPLQPRSPVAGPTLRLQQGTLTAQVSPQPHDSPFSIATRGADVSVLGTRFVVAVEDASTRVDVLSGSVSVKRRGDGATTVVPACHFAVSPSQGPLAASPAAPRLTAWLVAMYRFNDDPGMAVRDVSGFGSPLDLWVEPGSEVSWQAQGGLSIHGPALVASRAPALKIIEACRRSNQITIEAWVTPRTVRQLGPARIASLSRDTSWRDATLAMDGDPDGGLTDGGWFTARLRTTETGPNGMPELRSAPGSTTASLTHVVYTRDDDGTECIYLDAIKRSESHRDGDLANWDSSVRLALGNEFTRDRSWQGSYHLVAIYSQALTPADVTANFRAGLAPAL